MDYKNLLLSAVSVVMVLLIPVVIYGYSFNSVAFNENFYKKEFLEYNIYDDLKNYDADNINNDVLDYLKREKEDKLLENSFFSQREKKHLLDVKNLVQGLLGIYYFSITLFLISLALLAFLLNLGLKAVLERLSFILIFSSILALMAAFLLFAVSKTDFGFVFDMLHKTFFPVGTYTFNPEFERVVVLYPESLFSDAFAKITLKIIFSSAIILFIGIAGLLRFSRGKFSGFFRLNSRRRI